MHTMYVTCHVCCGLGKHRSWFPISEDRLEPKDVVCDACDGKGYTEHAVFSVEEAHAILKYCGLSKED